MRVRLDTAEELVLANNPAVARALVQLGTVLLGGFGVYILVAVQEMAGWIIVGSTLLSGLLVGLLIVRQMRLTLSRTSGEVRYEVRHAFGQREIRFPLSALAGARRQVYTYNNGTTWHTILIRLDGEPPVKLGLGGTNGPGPARMEEAINGWLGR